MEIADLPWWFLFGGLTIYTLARIRGFRKCLYLYVDMVYTRKINNSCIGKPCRSKNI